MSVTLDDAITIQQQFPNQERHTAAEIYYQAFRKKLTPMIGNPETAVPFLAEVLDPEMCLTALFNGRIVGIAGLHHLDRQFARWRFADLARHFGWSSAIWRYFIASLFTRPQQAGELVMDGIAVTQSMRGKGVGTQLLNSVIAFGQTHHYTTVRLDVVDTNPDARRLYERLGFMPISTHHYPFMGPFGFTAVTTMLKSIGCPSMLTPT